jgi:trk system potassium uptake protein TrkA
MKKNKSVVIGSGRLGASIAAMLSDMGNDVVIIDKDDTSFRKLSDTFSGYDVIGDATDLSILENEALIREAKEVIITTDSDNVNLFIAHLCFNIIDVPNIFVRFSDTDKGKLIQNTTIKAIYPFILSINDFMQMRKDSQHENSHR